MVRALIDIGSLDLRVQEQVAKHGSLKDFSLALWRQEPDSTGIRRTHGNNGDPSWREVVGDMRQRFNLN
jgi:hypothetical protein